MTIDKMRKQETVWLRALTPQEGLRHFFSLLAEFSPLLDQSEPYYREERVQAMITLQSRLNALNTRQPQKANAKSR